MSPYAKIMVNRFPFKRAHSDDGSTERRLFVLSRIVGDAEERPHYAPGNQYM